MFLDQNACGGIEEKSKEEHWADLHWALCPTRIVEKGETTGGARRRR